jgi:hypothetical protein
MAQTLKKTAKSYVELPVAEFFSNLKKRWLLMVSVVQKKK